MSLKIKARKGVFWVAVERFGQQLIQIVIFIVLARLLSPKEFGLVAMIMIVFEISQIFIESGMGQALIREKEIVDKDRYTVFWFNFLAAGLFYAIIFLVAPLVSRFYDEPALTMLIRVMALAVFASGLSILQRAEMTQRMEFRKQAFAQLPAVAIAGVVSISMAFIGAGVWALVAQFMLVTILSSIMLWVLNPIKIKLAFDKSSFVRLFGFGYKLLISGLIDTIYQNIYKLVIGKSFAASTLGLYTQASKIKDLASNNLISIIQKVTYPLMVERHENPVELKRAYKNIVRLSSFVIIPLMLTLIILAGPIMEFILGPQWLEGAPFLQLICIGGVLYHLHAINLNLLKVYGRSDLFLKLEVLKKGNVTLAIFIGIQFGIYGLLIGQVIASYIALFINTYYTAKFLNYPLLEQTFDVVKVAWSSVPMVCFLVLATQFYPINSLLMLMLYLGVSVLVYLISNLVIKSQTSKQVFDLLDPYLPKYFKSIFHI